MILGLKRGTNKIVPYQKEWKEFFDSEKKLIKNIIGKQALDIQHVGSTAVPGLSAKPIIDIAVGIENLSEVEEFTVKFEQEGYVYFGEHDIPGQLLFVKGPESSRTHYIHMVKINSWKWNEYIQFRDHLTANADLRQEYADLKEQLVRKYPADRKAYIKAKAEFIKKALH